MRVDWITGRVITDAKPLVATNDNGKSVVYLSLMEQKGNITITIRTIGATGECFGFDNRVYAVFRDGTRVEAKNILRIDCKNCFIMVFNSHEGAFTNKGVLDVFMSREVDEMRIHTKEGYVEVKFNKQQSKQLMRSVRCLVNNSKTL